MSKVSDEQLQHGRQHHIGRQLQQAYRDFNTRSLHKLRARGHAQLSAAHLNIIPFLDLDGTRINTLAERAGMTKQAASQLVTELEKSGYVTRQPDPSDGRAALLTFTAKGQALLQDAHALKREIADEYRAKLGEDRWHALQDALSGLLLPET
ncbi:MarR family winged helix-turn-helix transcriptional regulator [Deinococcus fonticola]|uniref:MarR family winged helix-turn-helix transcriptional regulator n=1 Tax=Deinococcus fonticola TaxID=2528713 RepID=UPI0010754F41|nr:MarR family transcriptional regulator [Deinococcus fonticola]